MIALEIAIPIASTWPSRDELAARSAVEAALLAAAVGKCTGAGGGMGMMHLTCRVDNESWISAARAVIDEAMAKHMPSCRFEVTAHGEA
jgi:hypothetical protein